MGPSSLSHKPQQEAKRPQKTRAALDRSSIAWYTSSPGPSHQTLGSLCLCGLWGHELTSTRRFEVSEAPRSRLEASFSMPSSFLRRGDHAKQKRVLGGGNLVENTRGYVDSMVL